MNWNQFTTGELASIVWSNEINKKDIETIGNIIILRLIQEKVFIEFHKRLFEDNPINNKEMG